MKRFSQILFLLFVTASQVANAHPGHGNKELDGYSIMHYLLEPTHLFSSVFILVLVIAVVRKVRKVRAEKAEKK